MTNDRMDYSEAVEAVRAGCVEVEAEIDDDERCRYSDCPEDHPVIPDDEDDERVTCSTCRESLGLPLDLNREGDPAFNGAFG
jgi:hypothetical protein